MVHKHKQKKQMTKMEKRILTVLLVGIIGCSSLITAAWLIQYDSGITGYVISSDINVTFDESFSIDNVNSSNETLFKSENITVINDGEQFDMEIEIITTVTDVADGCNNTNDTLVSVGQSNTVLNDGDTITIENGLNTIVVNNTVVPYACPQTVETRINLLPL